ncbi:phytanoyl-CoA dioxygenase family protein [Aspergillus ruber CBS 135680]|uniref:Phytanoyl-CoA dioxygenase family protein n=1 Tax=Aspergillus ruber (strain CBS 135680) TaxID=1388766 RepID=A0A017SI68_ASPRC|nr:phytanoyl-CoA dioxygenase family protein [Aspergillus ruber CBS 135680]EYE96623.1 phytanoyl-CoA dioxygenase family protein [Aspergillus ruber CBS 135680]
MTNKYLSSLQRDGYVLIPSLFAPTEITNLRNTASRAASLARTGSWPHFRTVPKQFPPWPKEPPPAEEGGIWGVQHLLHPEVEGRSEFAGVYFSEKVLGIVEKLLLPDGDKGEGEALVMELFNMLVAPEARDFELRWHRDDIPETASAEEEERLLQAKSPQGRQSHAQYNLALCPDASLVVVPGSHRRVRTETERNAAPYEPSLPGQKIVELQPGDAVFYDSNILHRGVYKGKLAGGAETRLTLHGSVGLKAAGGQKVRATAVLQHGVGAWVYREDAAFGVGERAERMRANLVAMGTGEGVGYSLQG